MLKHIISLILVLLSFYTFGTEMPLAFIDPLDLELDINDRLVVRQVAQTFRKNMPEELHKKIFDQKLHKKCVFLSCVHDSDYDSVKWITEHDTVFIKKPLRYYTLTFAPDAYDPCSYYQYNPHMIANHKQDTKILTILDRHKFFGKWMGHNESNASNNYYLLNHLASNNPKNISLCSSGIEFDNNNVCLAIYIAILNCNVELLSSLSQIELFNKEIMYKSELFLKKIIWSHYDKLSLVETLLKTNVFNLNKQNWRCQFTEGFTILDYVFNAIKYEDGTWPEDNDITCEIWLKSKDTCNYQPL